MRVLVTGGAGFVGSYVVRELADAGHEVVVVDALLPLAHAGAEPALEPGAEYVWGDLADLAVAAAAVAGIEAVSHQASMVGLGVDFGDVGRYVHHNDTATASLLGALHDRRFRGRLVLAGSMVVYGEGRYRCTEHGVQRRGPRPEAQLRAQQWDPTCGVCGAALRPEPVPEDAPTDPRSVYAATKLHQEHLCACFGREHDVAVTALRYHNVYGPGMPRNTPYAGVASIFRSAIERGVAPQVFEDGGQLRDFVHVRDIARANRLALEAIDPVDGPLDVASGSPRTVYELADALCRRTGDERVTPQVVPRYRLGDVRHVFASTAAIREQLGFTPQVAFDEGIDEFVAEPLLGLIKVSTGVRLAEEELREWSRHIMFRTRRSTNRRQRARGFGRPGGHPRRAS